MTQPPDPDELSDAAKKELAAAFAIVREDKLRADIRALKPKDPPRPPNDPAPDPAGEPPKDPTGGPPPPKDPAPLPKRQGLWWGDRVEDEPPPTPAT